MSLCQIEPISAFMSTNLNSKVECFQRLGERILRTLGHPMINVELHYDQLHECISMALDFYTVYSGYTKEYLIFNSRLYEKNKGIRLDTLFTVANSGYTPSEKLNNKKIGPQPDYEIDIPDPLYVSLSSIPNSYFVSSSALSGVIPSDGISSMQIIDKKTYDMLVEFDQGLGILFKESIQKSFTIQCELQENVEKFNNMFDYDVMDYRKVVDVIRFEEGSTTGVNTLFSVEQTMAQQSFHAYSLGNYGFDILSWHTVKDWLDTREKMFATRRDIYFDPRTQYLKLIPQPKNTQFYGLLECYVERPLRDLVKEKWVLEYATALAKVMWGRILTKINGVNLPGGGTINGDTILNEGVNEKKELEQFLIEGGFGTMDPPLMLVM
jgi:hypothetical protein